ncbi:MAG TPA: sulfite exporter TauE/SafE family protein [Candidatus Nanoarchaeia archaeon]|nr:sulfite exporter TauE/SafE family protein [Candidatus Nanoarchaeia archaeon]
MFEYLSFGVLALLLGFKHSYDADHLVAVSNILRRAKSLKFAVKTSASWAVGHMVTATIITMILFLSRDSIIKAMLGHFEKIAGVMIIALGLWSIFSVIGFHLHKHKHGKEAHSHFHFHNREQKEEHSHKHMLGIGIVHGLASNDELLLLFTASLGITSLGGIVLGISIFSIGVVLGMIAFAFVFTYPLIKMHSEKVYRYVSIASGTIGVIYGFFMLTSLL